MILKKAPQLRFAVLAKQSRQIPIKFSKRRDTVTLPVEANVEARDWSTSKSVMTAATASIANRMTRTSQFRRGVLEHRLNLAIAYMGKFLIH